MLRRMQLSRLSGGQAVLLALGVGAAAYVGYSTAKSSTENRVAFRPDDDAPPRTARNQPVSGRTITINRPREELFAFWAEFSNLPQFMQGIRAVSMEGDVARWDISGPLGQTVTLRTTLTERRDSEFLAWQSTASSDLKASGQITFRDAPAGRGTELEAEINYHPPLGELGRWIGKLFQTDPVIQGRRELRRFKMLMETGEIATNINHKVQR
jgi:uncharacterized membrane protein